jgi:glycosyltransferase involved in cell wall biosynthesis
MKVLYFIPSFGSGGAERQLSLIAPALVSRGIEVHVAHAALGPNHQRIANSGVWMHRLHISNNHDLRLLWRAVSLIRSVGPDIIQTWLLQMDVFGGIAAKLTGKPLIFSERSSAANYPPHWKHTLRAFIGRRADAIIANSDGGLEYWRHQRAKGSLHLIRNCIVAATGSTATPATKDPCTQIVLFAGRLSPEKNVDRLLEAFVLIARARPEVEIRMFGEGPLEEGLARRLAETGLGSRILLGGFTSEIAVWMSAADLCVSVSAWEGHPNVVLEAASLGCPLVLSDIPAHREVIGDEAAVFVDEASVTDISDGILRTLDDPQAARRRARRALDAVSRFTLESVAQGYVEAYRQVLAATDK